MDTASGAPNRKIVLLSCNVDDMTGEDIGYAREKIAQAGAMEFYTLPVQMKKNRPGYEIRVVCRIADADAIAFALMKHTSTFGIRRREMDAYALERTFDVIHTPNGDVRRVIAKGYGVWKEKLEYDDVCAYAEKAGVSIKTAREEIYSYLNK